MIDIILIDKKGQVKNASVKSTECDALSRRAGFKSVDGFEKRTTWGCTVKGKKFSVALYAKDAGRANYENKYDLPPPVDSVLYFGTMVLVNYSGDKPVNISVDDWNHIYEHLFGGFEDLGNEEESEESEEESEEDRPRTKEGYVIDDFVVPDDELSEEDYI